MRDRQAWEGIGSWWCGHYCLVVARRVARQSGGSIHVIHGSVTQSEKDLIKTNESMTQTKFLSESTDGAKSKMCGRQQLTEGPGKS